MPLYAPSSAGGVKNNFAAVADPTTSDDATAGYAAGSVWLRSDTGQSWRVRDASAGSAAWIPVHAGVRGYVAGRWYSLTTKGGATAASGASVAGSIYCTPFFVASRITISQLAVRITTLSAGNSNLALQGAIYRTSLTDINRPGVLVQSNSSAQFSTVGAASVTSSLNSAAQIEPGQYFFAVQPFDTTVKWAAFTPSIALNDTAILGGATGALVCNGSSVTCVTTTGTYGTWPDLTSVTMTESAVALGPAGGFLVSTVP